MEAKHKVTALVKHRPPHGKPWTERQEFVVELLKKHAGRISIGQINKLVVPVFGSPISSRSLDRLRANHGFPHLKNQRSALIRGLLEETGGLIGNQELARRVKDAFGHFFPNRSVNYYRKLFGYPTPTEQRSALIVAARKILQDAQGTIGVPEVNRRLLAFAGATLDRRVLQRIRDELSYVGPKQQRQRVVFAEARGLLLKSKGRISNKEILRQCYKKYGFQVRPQRIDALRDELGVMPSSEAQLRRMGELSSVYWKGYRRKHPELYTQLICTHCKQEYEIYSAAARGRAKRNHRPFCSRACFRAQQKKEMANG